MEPNKHVKTADKGALANLRLLNPNERPVDLSKRAQQLGARGLAYKLPGAGASRKPCQAKKIKPLGFTIFHDPNPSEVGGSQADNGSAPK